MTEFRRLLGYLKPYRGIFLLSVVLMIYDRPAPRRRDFLFAADLRRIVKSNRESLLKFLPFEQYLPDSGTANLQIVAFLLLALLWPKASPECSRPIR